MMTQTSTTSDLKCDQILKIVAISVWEKDGNEGEPPIPTIEDLKAFIKPFRAEIKPVFSSNEITISASEIDNDPEPEIWHEQAWYWLIRCVQTHRKKKMRSDGTKKNG